jgi:hypothetical protein
MALPLLNPTLTSSALSVFRAFPENGTMTVPLFLQSPVHGLQIRTTPLTPTNLRDITPGLLALAAGGESPDHPWKREIFSTPTRAYFENPDEGIGVRIEIGTAFARNLSESPRGITVSFRRYGDFGLAAMTAAFDPMSPRKNVSLLYDLEWSEAGIFGLRALLGCPEDQPIYEVSLEIFHHLRLRGDLQPKNPYDRLAVESRQNEWVGTDPDGAFVTILGGLDDAMSEAYGDIVERLRLEVGTMDDHPGLPASLLALWADAGSAAADSNPSQHQDRIRADREAYRQWVQRVYGTESLPPPSQCKD